MIRIPQPISATVFLECSLNPFIRTAAMTLPSADEHVLDTQSYLTISEA